MHSLLVVVGFFLMILAPCAFAVFSSKEKQDSSTFRPISPAQRFHTAERSSSASWRATSSSPSADYDLVLSGDPPRARPRPEPAASSVSTHSAPVEVYVTPSAPRRSRGASNLLNAAAAAEADSIAAHVYAAQANKAALAAAARAAAARAAAASALASEAERAVAEATRLAAAVRRAYETAPASVGPEKHALPETHPSMDFPRSHVIHRAA